MIDTRGNEVASNILQSFQNTVVLSERFVQRVTNIVYMILIRASDPKQVVVINEMIDELKTDMSSVIIFSPEFTKRLIGELYLALGRQTAINESKD